jgi:hypothetical protein
LLVASLILRRHFPRYKELPVAQLHAMNVHGNKSYRFTYFKVGTRCSIKLRKARGTKYVPRVAYVRNLRKYDYLERLKEDTEKELEVANIWCT